MPTLNMFSMSMTARDLMEHPDKNILDTRKVSRIYKNGYEFE